MPTAASVSACDPDARVEALQREVARDLEQDIADEEDAGGGPVDARAEAKILVHCKRGEADIHAVEEIHRVAEAKERQEAPRRLADRQPCRLLAAHRAAPRSHLA